MADKWYYEFDLSLTAGTISVRAMYACLWCGSVYAHIRNQRCRVCGFTGPMPTADELIEKYQQEPMGIGEVDSSYAENKSVPKSRIARWWGREDA